MPKQKKFRIIRKNFERALATESSPNETPITFNNIGFYLHAIENAAGTDPISEFIFSTIVKESPTSPNYTKPYKYRIRKSSLDFRTLCLIHPASQWRISEFYRDYSGQILHFCSRSRFSIRSPASPATTVFIPEKGRSPPSTNLRLRGSEDKFNFFAYKGYDRLYKFFNSKRFVNLESKFPVLMKLDITKCFDSIYTHSITWATRNKEYAKAHTHIRAFANDFDTLMQKCNYNETNGIPIGPEVSRIFSEIIFQDIDCSVEIKAGGNPGRSYSVARYVDDIYIFASTQETAEKIYELYVQELSAYNLHPNKLKTEIMIRPFFTSKSKVIRDVNLCINQFVDGFLKSSSDRHALEAQLIFNRNKLTRSFVDSIKSACVVNDVQYDEVVPYIISALTRRSTKLVRASKSLVRDFPDRYFDASVALLETSFFFYGVAPSVTASYDLCTTIITLHNFALRNFPQDAASVKQLVHDGCLRLFEGSWGQMRSDIDGFVFLEAINIALATCAHGADFMIPEDKLRSVLPEMPRADYFQLMAILYYCKDDPRYLNLRDDAIAEVDHRLRDLSGIRHDSHQAHIFLDALCCPHIKSSRRAKWLRRLFKTTSQAEPTKAEIYDFLEVSPTRPWFTDWLEDDLLAALGRKKLHQAYA